MSKTWFLMLQNNNDGELLKGKIEDGKVEINKKEFILDNSYPIRVKKGIIGGADLYILKWDNIRPAKNVHRLVKEVDDNGNIIDQPVLLRNAKVEKIYPKFEKEYDMTPDQLKRMSGMKILGNMIPIKKQGDFKMIVVFVAIAGAIGLTIAMLQLTGIVKFF